MNFPAMALKTLLGGDFSFKFTESEVPFLEPKFYESLPNLRCIRIQRWFSKGHKDIVEKFLRPLCNQLGIWLVYEIDDVLVYDEVPKFNLAKETFSPEKIGESPKEIMQMCDLVTVTTEELKNLYVHSFSLNPEKIVVIPNFLPRWWIGDAFSLDKSMKIWEKNKLKPRIAFACSTNHFDVLHKNNGIDDFSALIPWIERNINRYRFVFVGGCPEQLKKAAQEGKVEVQSPSDILNYPRELMIRNIGLLVAPLVDIPFNRCKSNIKWLETSALGIPMIGQNISTYNKYTNQVFSKPVDIDKWIERLFFLHDSKDYVANMLQKNRKEVEEKWWLESNLIHYYELYSMQQRMVEINV